MKQLIILTTILVILSCSNENTKIITLNTDLAEVVPFIEEFNSNNKSIKIVIDSTLNSSSKGDLVIFKGQKDSCPYTTKDIKNLLNKNINKNLFFPDILESVMEPNGGYNLLPLTFNIDGFIYNKHNILNPMHIDIDAFITNKDTIFSPFWDNDFLLWYYLSNIPEFDPEMDFLDWDEFKNSANSINTMVQHRDKKWSLQAFNKKYMHLSPELLINNSIIDYYFYNLTDYLLIDETFRENIVFSFISNNGLISTQDEMIYIGINSRSRRNREAAEVITWMFDFENQKNFIDRNHKTTSLNQLFNGELSTLKDITTKIIPQYYPSLKLLIPKTEMITPPMTLPPLWDSLKSEVFIPLFNDISILPENIWKKKYKEYYEDWSKKNNK